MSNRVSHRKMCDLSPENNTMTFIRFPINRRRWRFQHAKKRYSEEALQVCTKKRKKLAWPRRSMDVPSSPNQRWSMDFVSGQLSNGRRFSILNVVDYFFREMVGQFVSVSIGGR